MTLDNINWPALRQRAAIARSDAQARCRDSAALRQVLTDIMGVQLQASYPAEARSVTLARTAVARLAAQAGAIEQRLDAIKLAVSEAITNAVVHAYPDRRGSVYVRAAVVDGQFRVRIIDEGRGPHVPSRTPGLGSGLNLIAASADQFTIRRRRTRGTQVDTRWTPHTRPTHSLGSPETDGRRPKL
jgi:anti-sigma regulatory factor (Ser/Thr protein kinase)